MTAGGGAGSAASRSGGGGSVAQPARATATTSALSKRDVTLDRFMDSLNIGEVKIDSERVAFK